MVMNIRANQVCETLLTTIKASNLNYLVNETPYSAFITIRKRFTKDYNESSNVTLARELDVGVNSNRKENENSILHNECQTLKTELELNMKLNSDLKNNLEGYVNENVAITQKLFILKGELASQNESIKKEHEKNISTARENQSVNDQLKVALNKLEEAKKLIGEKDDTVEILNSIVPNTKLELTSLEDKITELKSGVSISEPCSVAFTCDQCNFTSESNKGLNIHMGRMHEVKCDKCNEKFGGDLKFETHMCRIQVTNPTFNSIYMKNWYIQNECIQLFCNEDKKQIAILHSKECVNLKPCPDLPKKIISGEIIKDLNDILHILGYPLTNIDTIDWDILNTFIYATDHQTEETFNK